MDIGLIGLPQSGKTTVFQALTGQQPTGSGHMEPNVAVVKVPDERIDRLAELFHSKKIVHATVRYVDLPGVSSELTQGKGLPEEHLRHLGLVDALLAVLRGFESGGIAPDISGELDSIHTELILSDLQKVENRLEKLEKSVKKVSGDERNKQQRELDAVQKIHAALNANQAIRELELDPEEKKAIRGFQFLSEKPILYLVNIGEDDQLEQRDCTGAIAAWSSRPRAAAAQLCAQIEMEIASLEGEDRESFLSDYKIQQAAAETIIRQCYDLLGNITFLTAGDPETHAWTIPSGSKAPQAAGAIHTDFEKGFIRAEVSLYEDLIQLGSFAELKKQAKLRMEGKDYTVQDGDVMHFLFNK
ncbi:redox-regulated ATPase YchF [Candidatus Sumerlaeota bacterium]|nr:redox-regulated ATPase YchF [Candidatus Sumerlaeota bacterium]